MIRIIIEIDGKVYEDYLIKSITDKGKKETNATQSEKVKG